MSFLLGPQAADTDLCGRDDDKLSRRMGLHARPSLLQPRKAIHQVHLAQSQKDDAVTGQSVAKNQITEVFVGSQNDSSFGLGSSSQSESAAPGWTSDAYRTS